MTRRLAALLCAALLAACGGGDDDDTPPDPPTEVTDPLPYVDPTIGTGGLGFAHGACFVGAVVPHGLVKLGPDTSGPFGTIGFQHFSGYFYDDDRIQGFSHLHLHGAGATDLGVLSVMPTTTFAPSLTSVIDHEARFAKADESARPGRYAVTLADGTLVELTATARGAHHRYTLPGAGHLVIDLAKELGDDGGVTDAEVHLDAATQTITGRLHHGGGLSGRYGGYELWFAARTRQPWTEGLVWADGADAAVGTDAAGVGVGAALGFDGDAPVELQLAVSLVSAEGARANLDAELPAWDFEATVAAAEAAWRDRLDAVRLTGGTDAERRTFYTSLYHAFLMPTVIEDADGAYRVAGVAAPLTSDGWTMLSDLSLWDTYRTVHSLYALVAPGSAYDSARSLAAFGDALGEVPRWPILIGEGGSMLGAPAEIVLADAVARDVPGADEVAAAAWPRLRAAAMDEVAPAGGRGGRDHVEAYMQYGYVPASVESSVSHTTEYAHADAALADLAARLGHDGDAATLAARARGWRALYDPAAGFLRKRAEDGSFEPVDDFDPHDQTDDYVEANAWQSLWMAGAVDLDGLVELLGGHAGFVAKLDELFDGTAADWALGDPAAANFPRPFYWHGNEPDLNAAFLYAQAGEHARTVRWSRWIQDHLYGDRPDGVAGNDDGGTLGSWYVLATLGIYPVPGTDAWILAAPRFPSARVTLEGGHELIIVGDGLSTDPAIAATQTVEEILLDGTPVTTPTVSHAALVAADELRFVFAAP